MHDSDELEQDPVMAMVERELELEPDRPTFRPEPKRDRWKRALLLTPDGERKAYTRVSTIAKALQDGEGIAVWKLRCGAVGFRDRPDLWNLACSIRDPEGADKPEMTRVVKEAAEAGDKKQGANQGTARHKYLEAWEQGTPLSQMTMTDEVKRDLEAYIDALDRYGLEPVGALSETHGTIEAFDYNGLGVSGSFDNVFKERGGSRLLLGDKKTAQAVKYGKLEWAIQFALYANFQHIYDVVTDTRQPMVDVDKDIALAVWLPTGGGKCEIFDVDIVRGMEFAYDAVRARAARWHGQRDLRMEQCLFTPRAFAVGAPVTPLAPVLEPLRTSPAPVNGRPVAPLGSTVTSNPPTITATRSGLVDVVPASSGLDMSKLNRHDDDRREWLKQRLRGMSPTAQQLVAGYWDRDVVPPLSSDHRHTVAELDMIDRWCTRAEKDSGQVEDISADPTVVNARNLLKWFPGTIDEGTQLEPEQIATLQANMALWCRQEWLALFADWRDEAIRLGRDFGLKECPTTRRAKLYELGANLCNLLEGHADKNNIDQAWAVLVNACSWSTLPDVPFGLALSLLTIEQVERALQVTMQTPFLELCYGVEGCPTLPYWRPAGAGART